MGQSRLSAGIDGVERPHALRIHRAENGPDAATVSGDGVHRTLALGSPCVGRRHRYMHATLVHEDEVFKECVGLPELEPFAQLDDARLVALYRVGRLFFGCIPVCAGRGRRSRR